MGVAEQAATTVPAGRAEILLVEDDADDAVRVREHLAEAGFAAQSVTWVRTVADALNGLAADPSCILLDLGRPDADGHGAVQTMVSAAPDTPVIVLTGYQDRDGVAALAAGAQDYLAKNVISGESLERSIRYAIERKRAQATRQQLADVRISAAEQARLERGLLPNPLLRSRYVSCATYYRPGSDGAVLGGDFFDVVETDDGRIRAVMGDVMGHGPDEAALGVHLRVAWRTLVLAGTPDAKILPIMSTLLSVEPEQARRFVTICDLTLGRGELTVRLAGHPAPIVCLAGAAEYLDLQVGAPLGIAGRDGSPHWPTNAAVSISDGSSIVLYTDGLLDAYADNAVSDSIGVNELVSAVSACTFLDPSPASWIPRLLANAPRDPVDDTAVVVITVPGNR